MNESARQCWAWARWGDYKGLPLPSSLLCGLLVLEKKASLVLLERRNLSCGWYYKGGKCFHLPRAEELGITILMVAWPFTNHCPQQEGLPQPIPQHHTYARHRSAAQPELLFFLIPFLHFLRIYPFLKFGQSLFSFPCSECVSIKTQAGYHPLGNCLLSLSYYYFSLWPCCEKCYVDYYFFFL